jgi:hypothetical protein
MSLLGLAPGGVYRATPVARSPVRSYRTLSPLPTAFAMGGLLSVALSFGSPRLACASTLPCGARTFLDAVSDAAIPFAPSAACPPAPSLTPASHRHNACGFHAPIPNAVSLGSPGRWIVRRGQPGKHAPLSHGKATSNTMSWSSKNPRAGPRMHRSKSYSRSAPASRHEVKSGSRASRM